MNTTTLKCEYLWLDGGPTPELRSKTRVLSLQSEKEDWTITIKDIPLWNFDGSSTGQAETDASDLVLRPVYACLDSNRENGVIVLCDVLNPDMTPHESNYRARLVDEMIKFHTTEPRIGFEQEYFMTKGDGVFGHVDSTTAIRGQGPYYCAVGAQNVVGRNLAELHLNACISSGLSIVGLNAEVALGQWEYQVGGPTVNALEACDHLWVSRFILHRICELQDIGVTFDPKPLGKDWNGSGMHSNFSTATMRDAGGISAINKACEALGAEQALSVALESYGEGLDRRLTGEYETCSIDEYRYGVSDRSASIRIPSHVKKAGSGYFEDRRPNSNADPYRVATSLVSLVCSLEG
jgi:glutamine synthetase